MGYWEDYEWLRDRDREMDAAKAGRTVKEQQDFEQKQYEEHVQRLIKQHGVSSFDALPTRVKAGLINR